ncbi:hypothetical protein B6D60_11150 [candidate division KSB1 bacterium 4484_87]|nr:MAG: hypothetical protein B6D60_11150 [candidate division KSB1 bacterium 4484_87]
MPRKTILIVNPDKRKRQRISAIVEKEGYSTLSSANTKDGFDLARKKKPHLIISAHQAGHIDGIDFCYMIRNHPRLATTPFMLFISYIPWNERLSAHHIGVNDIVNESVRDEELLERIGSLLSYFDLISQKALKGNQAFIGKLEDFKLAEIIQMLNLNQKSGILTIYRDIADGQIALENGEITFALVQTFSGEDAVEEMMSWRRGIFVFEKDVMETEKNIDKPTMQLLLDCSKRLDESAAEEK